MDDVQKLILISVVVTIFGLGCAIFLAFRHNYIDFIKTSHLYALGMLLLAGGLYWLSMITMINSGGFNVSTKQWVALIMSLLISVLWWLRLALSLEK